ncbi:hypothetical protein DVH02_25780 [Streptomyces corynorhini]|uniref:Uncharacterized protein n=1 Tax=Streptomyces corynorhini TaxID=2282652 RepID=A0A370B667_9ACTN|nr:hypothetical protein DVH02_25780 [Streptomyces corynorhini]
MRHSIARALVACLRLILAAMLPATGKRRAASTAPSVPPVSPWTKPWAGPSSAEARAVFRAEESMVLTPVQRERRYAAGFAAHGVDYPYTGHGVHQVRTAVTA